MLSTLRHQEIFDPMQSAFPVSIIGAGAIGSRIYATLTELGVLDIDVYDFDTVEAHNLSNQLYSTSDVGHHKIDALADWSRRKLGLKSINDLPHRFFNHKVATTDHPDDHPAGVIFLLVDSLAARKELATLFIDNPRVPLLIDVRMAASHGEVYTVNPFTQGDAYLATIGSDDDAEVSACGSPFSVAPTAAILSNLAVWQYVNWCTSPSAVDSKVHAYFKPLAISASKL